MSFMASKLSVIKQFWYSIGALGLLLLGTDKWCHKYNKKYAKYFEHNTSWLFSPTDSHKRSAANPWNIYELRWRIVCKKCIFHHCLCSHVWFLQSNSLLYYWYGVRTCHTIYEKRSYFGLSISWKTNLNLSCSSDDDMWKIVEFHSWISSISVYWYQLLML